MAAKAAGRIVVGAAAGAAKRTRRKLRAPLTITPKAAERIQTILSGNNGAAGVRLGVRTRGCNGLSYTLNYAESADAMDEVVEENGVSVFIEPKALFHIVGTTMDFEETPLASQFVFVNPNATGMCGCGESFSVGETES